MQSLINNSAKKMSGLYNKVAKSSVQNYQRRSLKFIKFSLQ
jgi:hypothetical protein